MVGSAALRWRYAAEIARLLRCTRRAAARALLVGVMAAGLAGCADTPPEYNPIEWGRSAVRGVSGLFGGDDSEPEPPPPVEPPPAEGRPYPNLASVPRPPQPTPKAEREADVATLEAQRDAALEADRRLRESGTFPVAPPPPAITTEPAPPAPPAMSQATPPPAAASRSATPPARSAPPAVAQAQPPAATVSQRVGSVSFGRDAATLGAGAGQVLAQAAGVARARNGRVHLMPAHLARQAPSLELERARRAALMQTLERAGVPRERIVIDDGAGHRVDLYDVYVDS